jgi:esterase/lipase superfamily enzyme
VASRDDSGEKAQASQTNRPVIASQTRVVEGPTGNGGSAQQPPSVPFAPSTTNEHKTEVTFPDDVVDGALEKPRSANLGGNPLRGKEDQNPVAIPPIPNPLRTARNAPAAEPPPPPAPAPESSPSGGAPIPQFVPALPVPEGISLGSAAGGSAPRAPESERAARERELQARAAAEAAAREAEEARAQAARQFEEAERAQLKSAMPATTDAKPFEVVQVFYGTDRQAVETASGVWAGAVERFLPLGLSSLVTLCLLLAAVGRRNMTLGLCSLLSAAISIGLGYQAAMTTLAAIRQQDKEGLQYTSERALDAKVDLGLCEVSIPKIHKVGELEAPSIVRLEVREDAAQHIVLRKTERVNDRRYFDLLRQRVAASQRRELFVFVHGFNVSFEEAARRTAQIHYDLRFEGAPVFFSWPAHDKFLLTYPADENNVEWSAPHLKQFLLEVVKNSGAKSINLIAHSMGNRALAAALREIELEMRDQSRLFNQVILAAPDIDAHDFRTNIAPAMQRTAQRMTLYASARDDALLASQLLHRGPRAGDAGEGLVVVKGIDTIDVTAIDSSPWGHLYYGSSDPVLQDLKLLFSMAAAPGNRTWLSPAEREGLTYWIFQPTRTATAEERPVEPRF